MKPPSELLQLLEGLQAIQRGSGIGIAEASALLERHPKYLTRVLRGQLSLKVVEVFALLEIWKVAPEDFFDTYFPLGGNLVKRFRAESDQEANGNFRELGRLIRQAQVRSGNALLGPADWTERLGSLLIDKIRDSGKTQREVSLGLGLPAAALGQAMRGYSALLFWQVFGALRAIETSPGLFFAELFCVNLSVVEQLRPTEVLEEAERLLAQAAEDLERQLSEEEPRPTTA